MGRRTNVKRGIIFGVINNVLRLVLPFISRTIMLYIMGVAYLGLGGLFTSVLNVLSISELGLGAAISYLLYRPVAENDTNKVCAILSFARKSFRYVGIFILGSGLILLPFIRYLIKGDVPNDINVYLLYIIFLINSVVSYFLFSYKRVLLSAVQRYDLETIIASVTLIATYLIQILVLLLFANYYLYAIVFVFTSIVNNILCQYVTRRKFPEYVCRGEIGESEKNEIWKTIKGVFLSKLGSTVYLSVGNIVISSIFGLVLLGQYSNYYYVSSCLGAFFAVINNSLRPSLGNYMITETKEDTFDKLKKITYAYGWAGALCTCCMLSLFQDFIEIWAGKVNLFTFHFAIVMTLSFYATRLMAVPSVFVEASGLWHESRYVYIIAAIANIVLSILLSLTMGIVGVVYSTLITSVFICLSGYVFVLFKYFFKNRQQLVSYICRFTCDTILQLTAITSVVFICNMFKGESVIMLIIKGFASFILFSICYLILGLANRTQLNDTLKLIRTTIIH